MSAYLVSIAIVALILVISGLGLNLEWGHAGLLNFGHVAFYAVGAYTYALLALRGVTPLLAIAAAAIAAGLLAAILGWSTVRLKEDYLAIVALAVSEIVRLVAINSDWAGGSSGLVAVPSPFSQLALGPNSRIYLLVTLSVLVVVSIYLLSRLTRSRFGLALQSIRDNELAAEAIGKNVLSFKLKSLVIGSMMAGVAGSFYAMYVTYVVPDQFIPLVTFYAWVGIILGGSSHIGAAIGTFLFVALQEATRFMSDFGVDISDAQMARIRILVIGLALIVLMRFRPQGVLPAKRSINKGVERIFRARLDSEDSRDALLTQSRVTK
jgi:branched-chain amino acid transport system permease protein